jgi:hypothetical protein
VFLTQSPTYLRVDATFKPDGVIVPTMLFWTDGSLFIIDRILDVRPGASLKHGGASLRHLCRIQGHERSLFLAENKWFVEEK